MQFEWHKQKNELNKRKHRVSFEEAVTAFNDPLGIVKQDEIHSIGEERNYLIGYSIKNKLLVISFTERDSIIRIISARNATKSEKKTYENQN